MAAEEDQHQMALLLGSILVERSTPIPSEEAFNHAYRTPRNTFLYPAYTSFGHIELFM